MKSTEQVEDIFRKHIEKILKNQTAITWCEDEKINSQIKELQSDISICYRDKDEYGRDECDFSSQYAETLIEACDRLEELNKCLTNKWDFEYSFIETLDATPIYAPCSPLILGWDITYLLTIGIGELLVFVKTIGKKIDVSIADRLVDEEIIRVADDFDLYKDIDQQRVLHYLNKK